MLRLCRPKWLYGQRLGRSRVVPQRRRWSSKGFSACSGSESVDVSPFRFQVAHLLAAVFAFGATMGGCSSAQVPLTSEQRARIESHAQDIIQPLIRGVAYDPRERHAYYSACAPREFACDLYRVDIGAPEPRAAVVFQSAQYGFVWPSLSPDGRSLAAVRVRRGERLSDRNESQDLVEIDLASGATRVLANAQGGRFTRVEHLSDDMIAVVRTYRSSPSFVCRGDLCTDRGEVLLVQNGTTSTLPMRTGDGARDVTFLPLFGRSVWVMVSTRHADIPNPQGAYVVDVANNRREVFPTRRDALDYVQETRGPSEDWDATTIRNGSYWVEELPFHRQLPLWLVVLQQTHLVDSRLAVGLEKRLAGGFVFQVCENQGRVPWDCSTTAFQAP